MLAPASDTTSVPWRLKSNPNGVAPADAVTTGVPGRPNRSSGNVSMRFETRSVTTSRRPSGVTAT